MPSVVTFVLCFPPRTWPRIAATCFWIATVNTKPYPITLVRGTTSLILILAVCLAASLNWSAIVRAQESSRKLLVAVQPEYPDLARRNNIKGAARFRLLVAPDGKVKEVKVLGGNPVLAQAGEQAVRKWKYERATAESTVVVKIDFNP